MPPTLTAPNPYAAALQVDPAREQEELVKLRNDPTKLASLGLAPGENFAALKSDPVKYNRVLSYVKSQVYRNPAYGALEAGQTRPEFVSGQLGTDFGSSPAEYRTKREGDLRSTYNLDPLRARAEMLEAGRYTAPATIAEEVKTKGGYDVEGERDAYTKQQAEYTNAYREFVGGRLSSADYAARVSAISQSARNLEKTTTGFNREVSKALGEYDSTTARAKDAFDNAYSRYNQALTADTTGYGEQRTEKIKAAEELYNSAKQLLDESRKERKGELRSIGGKLYEVRFNDATGRYETKLVQGKTTGNGSTDTDTSIIRKNPINPSNPTPLNDDNLPSFDEYVRAKTSRPAVRFPGEPVFRGAAGDFPPTPGQSPLDIQDPAALERLRDDYAKDISDQVDFKKISKIITSTDKQQMFRQGLDATNKVDIIKYLVTKKAGSGGAPATASGSRTL